MTSTSILDDGVLAALGADGQNGEQEAIAEKQRQQLQRQSQPQPFAAPQPQQAQSQSCVKNPHLASLPGGDFLYHLALGTTMHNLGEMFGDVRFVCVGGTAKRMEAFAYYVGQELNIKLQTGVTLQDITQNANRYSMYKIGPVLSVTHGMGAPSLSILLHELLKLIHYARCKDVVFLRLGTSGGLGVEPGSLVVTSGATDGLLRPYYEQPILGKLVRRAAVFDANLVAELKAIAEAELPDFATVSGITMCTSDFYEGQGRLDGAFCSYQEEDKMNWLQSLRNHGVVNIEMESVTFGAMCHSAGIAAGIICVTLLDRLKGDQVLLDKVQYDEFQKRPQLLAAKFIKKRLQN